MMLSKSNCHTGNPLVFEAQGVKVYAGGNTRDGGWIKMKPLPDLAIGPTGVIRTMKTRNFFPSGWTCADNISVRDAPHIIELEWPDFSIPSDVTRPFWVALVDDILSKGIKTVSTQCMGGHGRTGVQLCILAHLMIPQEQHSWKDSAELVKHIRDIYCHHAVEGRSQQKYIADVLEIPIGEDLFKVKNVTTRTNLWNEYDGLQFDADELEAELEEDETPRRGKHSSKVKQYGQKLKIKGRVERSKNAIGGFAVAACESCTFVEFRKNNPKALDVGCGICGDTIDRDYSDLQLSEPAFQDCRCTSCEKDYHRLEMVNEDQCKLCFLQEDKPLNIKVIDSGETPMKRKFFCEITKKEWPIAFSMVVEGELVSIKGLEKMGNKLGMSDYQSMEILHNMGFGKGIEDSGWE